MYQYILRTFVAVYSILVLLANTPAEATADTTLGSPLSDVPCVWRSFADPYLLVHTHLYKEVATAPECHPHNRAAISLILVSGVEAKLFSIPQAGEKIIKSGHVYKEDGSLELSKAVESEFTKVSKGDVVNIERLARLVQELQVVATSVSNEAETSGASADLLGAIGTLSPLIDTLSSAHDMVISRKKETLESYKALRASYNSTFYPFEVDRKILDSESSGCLLIQHFINIHISEISSAGAVHLHMHSDRPSCFYCVQLLNYFAKKWAESTGKPWVVMVSSRDNPENADWCIWSGDLPPGHIIPSNNMREYGRDDRHDAAISSAELEAFTYKPGRPGKIIQMFFNTSLATAFAATF